MTSKMDRRQSKMSLFDLFSRPKVERSRGYHESGLTIVTELPQAPKAATTPVAQKPGRDSTTDHSKLTRNRNAPLTEQNPDNVVPNSLKTPSSTNSSSTKRPFASRLSINSSSFTQSPPNPPISSFLRFSSQNSQNSTPTPLRPSPSSSSSGQWEPPTLVQAFSMAVNRGNVLTSVISADAIIRHQKQDSASPAPSTDTTFETAANLGITKRSNSRRLSSALSGAGADVTKVENKVFVLINTGYILQYPSSGLHNRRPDRVLRLGPESAAFASDLIPGRHWVLHICEKMSADGKDLTNGNGEEGVRGFFKRLGTRVNKKTVGNLLLVLESPEEMEEWLHVIRRTIDVLAGRGPSILSLDPTMTSFSSKEKPTTDRPSVSESVVSGGSGNASSATTTTTTATATTTATTIHNVTTRRMSFFDDGDPTVQVHVKVTPPLGGGYRSPLHGSNDAHPDRISSVEDSTVKPGDSTFFFDPSTSSPVLLNSTSVASTSPQTFLYRPESSESAMSQPDIRPSQPGLVLRPMNLVSQQHINSLHIFKNGVSPMPIRSSDHRHHQSKMPEPPGSHLMATENVDDATETVLAATQLAGMSRKRRSLILADPGPSPSYIPESPSTRRNPITSKGPSPRLGSFQPSEMAPRRHSAMPDSYRTSVKHSHGIQPSRSVSNLSTLNQSNSGVVGPSGPAPSHPLPEQISSSRSPPSERFSSASNGPSNHLIRPASTLRRPSSFQVNSDSTPFLSTRKPLNFRSVSAQGNPSLVSLSEEQAAGSDEGATNSPFTPSAPPSSKLINSGHVPFLMDSSRSQFVLRSSSGGSYTAPRPLRLPVIPSMSVGNASHNWRQSGSQSSPFLPIGSPASTSRPNRASMGPLESSSAFPISRPKRYSTNTNSTTHSPSSISNTYSPFSPTIGTVPTAATPATPTSGASISIFPSQKMRSPPIPLLPGRSTPVHGSAAVHVPRHMSVNMTSGSSTSLSSLSPPPPSSTVQSNQMGQNGRQGTVNRLPSPPSSTGSSEQRQRSEIEVSNN